MEKTEFMIPFDIIPLPSGGVLYPNNVSEVKVELLTTADEDVLTSPNLLNSGKVFKVLLSRKIKDLPFDPDDLLVGDRNALLVYLRSTGYGELYPVKIVDPKTGEPFEATIDLSQLQIKGLGAKPDENGHFSFTLPRSKYVVKFKLLRARDEEDLSARIDLKNREGISKSITDRLSRQIVSINGNSDQMFVYNTIQVLPASDSLAFRKYYDEIEPGIDNNIAVINPTTGERVDTFFRVGVNFFWPDIRI